MNKERNAVVIFGAGMMGSGIAAMAALGGRKTYLVDVSLERAEAGLAKAKEALKIRYDNELDTLEEMNAALELLEAKASIDEVLDEVAIVVEAIIENLEIKQKVFAELDAKLPPEVIICSNTSGIQITLISALCAHPERTVTTHFWLPANLVPLVEVVKGDRTDMETAKFMVEELKKWKKTPVLVKKDLPGQLGNRIYQAMIRECVNIVAEDIASVEDVDNCISCGMAMRFPVWGPLKHVDAIGLELGATVQSTVLPHINNEPVVNPLMTEMLANGESGAKAGKGFYDWTVNDIGKAQEKRDKFIIEAVRIKTKLDAEY